MARHHTALLALAALAVAVLLFCRTTSSSAARPRVTDVTSETFDDFVAHDGAILMAYAPWCGHCTALKPTFAKVAAKDGSSRRWGWVDVTQHGAVGERLGLRAFPMIYRVRDGEFVEYRGDRTARSLREFAEE